MAADVVVENHGTVISFVAQNESAQQFLRDQVASESWQWLGRALCVEHRMAQGLVEALESAGLRIGVET